MEESPCSLCKRELGARTSEHHMIPKCLGGKGTTTLHEICHSKIHRTFSNKELKNYYHTPERLLEHEEIQKFIKWVAKRPIDYKDKLKHTNERKMKRNYR